MRKITLISLLVVLILTFFWHVPRKKINIPKAAGKQLSKKLPSEYIGEKITYDIKLGGMSMGKAVFNYLEQAELNGRLVNFMTFETNSLRFKDLEKIYSDSDSFLPLKVIRAINGLNMKEDIVENYDQKKFVLTITKLKKGREEEIQIKKKSSIHNAILLPFYIRQIAELKVGWNFAAQLPTQEFKITLVSMENIKIPQGAFETYHFASVPKKFDIWVTADKRKIPIKIKGSGALGYVFIMRDYSKPGSKEAGSRVRTPGQVAAKTEKF